MAGELLAVSQEDYAKMVASYYATQLPSIETLRDAAPEVAPEPVDEGPIFATNGGAFQVHVRHNGGEPKVIASGDAVTMKQVWRSYTKNRPGITVSLFDVTLQQERGVR